MNIAFISYWSCPLTRVGVLSSGGMNIYVLNLANYLGLLGHNVDIYTRVHKEHSEKIIKIHKGVRIIHLDNGPENNLELFSDKILKFMTTKNIKCNILHAHYYLSGSVGLNISKKLHLPLLQTFHSLGKTKELFAGIKDDKRINIEKNIVLNCNGIIASTELEKGDLIEYYGASSKKIHVISPGVNHHIFRPRGKIYSRNKLAINPKLKIILFVGRIDPVKGVTLLVESVNRLTLKYSKFKNNFRVLIIGGDIGSKTFWQNEEVKKIQMLITDMGLECCIKFIGSRSHSVLPYYYSTADVVVMPSLYESFGLVVLEAMACGAAVLVSKTGGLKYIVDNDENGRFFKSGDSGDLSEKLDQLLNSPLQLKKLGKKAFLSSQKFCWNIQAEKMVECYNRYL